MTPSQSWLFLFLLFYSIAITFYAYSWRSRYYEAESYRRYVAKQKAKERTRLDEIYTKSFYQD